MKKVMLLCVLMLPCGLRADEEYVSPDSLNQEQQPVVTQVKVGFGGTVIRGAQPVAAVNKPKPATEEDACRAKLAEIEKSKRAAEYKENLKTMQGAMEESFEAAILNALEKNKYSQESLGGRVKNSLATMTMTVGELDARIEDAQQKVRAEETGKRKLHMILTAIGTAAGVIGLELLGVYLVSRLKGSSVASSSSSNEKQP